MTKEIVVKFSQPFITDAKLAQQWKAKAIGDSGARDLIKAVISDFSNQVRLFPDSGAPDKLINSLNLGERYRVLLKGEYKFLYKLSESDDKILIDVLIFCHQRMDYNTLLKQRLLQGLL
ncbi:type II toxin-antitoxin system RelE/ParE family toxin [Shewanella algae]|uniref:type II toxin-antitoxin system RelE/ParE family toxin n=1 Tax=Shewanella algae TaxID=38313 RepID=UPI0031F4B6FA